MHLALNCLLLIGVIVFTANAAHLPKTFKTCKNSDPNYQTCIKDAVESALAEMKDGLPSLGLPKIEPLFVEKIDIEGNGGKVDIAQHFTDLKIHGFGGSQVKELKWYLDGDDCKLTLSAFTPTLRLEGQYKILGKVLILQINGFGGANITLNNLTSDHEITCEKVDDKNGKKVLKLGDYNLKIKTEQIIFDFENVVPGNPELTAEILKVMNDSSNEIFEEIRHDYERTFAQILSHAAMYILSKVPYDEYYKP